MPESDAYITDFRQQPVWREAFRLSVDVYHLSGSATKASDEQWSGIATLVRRSVSAMGAQVAEGCTHFGRAESALFFQLALGGTSEILHHLLVARELEHITPAQFATLERQLTSLRATLVDVLRDLGADTVPMPEPAF